MTRPGGLGRGLSSLIPSKNNQQKSISDSENTESDKTEVSLEDDVFYSSDSKSEKGRKLPKLGDLKTVSKKKDAKVFGSEGRESVIKEFSQEQPVVEVGVDSSEKRVEVIPVDSVVPNPYQPRKVFDLEKIEELANSISEHGLIQPLVVTSLGGGKFELIAGERRLRASKLAGLATIPAIIESAIEDQKKAELALIENLQRSDLNIMEEVRAYKRLQEEFEMTQEQIAKKVGKSRSRVANALRLLNLPAEIQRGLMEQIISEGHARVLLSLEDDEDKRAFYEKIIKDGWSVRQVEGKIRKYLKKEVKPAQSQSDPIIYQKESQISSRLGTRVRIKKRNKSGQIVIEFYSDEELEELVDRLG